MTNKPPRPITDADLSAKDYDLLSPDGFAAYALRFGMPAARSARFLLAYSGPSTFRKQSDPEPQPLPQRYSLAQRATGHKLRQLFNADYAAIEARAMAWVKHEYPPVNPTPAYCWYMSAASLCAVYKAHVSSDPYYDFANWHDLSYATDHGIVFG